MTRTLKPASSAKASGARAGEQDDDEVDQQEQNRGQAGLAQIFHEPGINADKGEAGEKRRLARSAEAQCALLDHIHMVQPRHGQQPAKPVVKSGPQMAARLTTWTRGTGIRTKLNKNGRPSR
jgi:hypothetical protein